jgi:hypothetical protein
MAETSDERPTRINTMSNAGVIILIIFVLLVIFLFYYLIYRVYSRGQDKCTELYPGKSLAMLRQREACKDNKRKTWSLPFAAWILS